MSRLTTTSEIGLATSAFGVVTLVSTITLLGMEYTIIKNTFHQRSQILGTTITIELILNIACIPILLYYFNYTSNGLLRELTLPAIGIFIFSSMRYILRFALLGISKAKSVLLINSAGTGVQLVIGFILVSLDLGSFGIILSLLMQLLLITTLSLIEARKSLKFKFGNISYFGAIIKDSLINTPSQLSRVIMFSLSIVLLTSLGINQSEIGIFYMALMISFVVGGFAANIALMTLPSSSHKQIDVSTDSTRIGLSLSAPLVTLMIVSPKIVLSLIGPAYISAQTILVVLAAGIIPQIIVINVIAKFNNLNKQGKIILIGAIQVGVFVISFILLTPSYGTLGTAYSILIAYFVTFVVSLVWSDRILLKYLLISGTSVLSGVLISYPLHWVSANSYLITLIPPVITIALVFTLRGTSFEEIRQLASGFVGKG